MQSNATKKELVVFFLLLLCGVIAIAYYFYKATFRFDPYYRFKSEEQEKRLINKQKTLIDP